MSSIGDNEMTRDPQPLSKRIHVPNCFLKAEINVGLLEQLQSFVPKVKVSSKILLLNIQDK